MNWNSAMDVIAGESIGTITFTRVCTALHPSILAASSNDFMGPLLYVNTPAKYPLAIFVKMSMDADSGFQWNRILALSLISIIPSLVVFFMAQDKFVDGISAGGVKG